MTDILGGYKTTEGKAYEQDGKICIDCCGFPPTHSEDDCCCFLDPSPAAWDTEVVYDLFAAVSHEGSNWYSTIPDNQGNEPGINGQWEEYEDCENEDWNSFPPFGGIKKTPKYYVVAFKGYGHFENNAYNLYCGLVVENYCNIEVRGMFVLTQTEAEPCRWTGSGEIGTNIHVSWIYEQIAHHPNYNNMSGNETDGIFEGNVCSCTLDLDANTLDISIPYNLCTSLSAYFIRCFYGPFYYNNPLVGDPAPLGIDACKIAGSDVANDENTVYDVTCPSDIIAYHNIDYSFSWRPLDCNYTLYSEDENYQTNDCVIHAGKFWVACNQNGPDTPNGVQEPTGTETTCTTNYWRLVE